MIAVVTHDDKDPVWIDSAVKNLTWGKKRAFKDYEANTTNKLLFGHCQSMHNQLSVTIEYLGRLLLLHIRQI